MKGIRSCTQIAKQKAEGFWSLSEKKSNTRGIFSESSYFCREGCIGKEKGQNIKGVLCKEPLLLSIPYYKWVHWKEWTRVRNDCRVAVTCNSTRLHLKLLRLIFKMTIALENGLQWQ